MSRFICLYVDVSCFGTICWRNSLCSVALPLFLCQRSVDYIYGGLLQVSILFHGFFFLVYSFANTALDLLLSAFFCFILACLIFPIHLLLIHMFINIFWYVSYRQDTVGWCFSAQSDNLRLLAGAFRPLASKLIIYIVWLISIMFVSVFCSVPLHFVLIFVFYTFSAFCVLTEHVIWFLLTISVILFLIPCF